MSDYLTNLVTRSTERGNLLTPRLPSVFEPVVGGPQPQIFESSDETGLALTQLRSLTEPKLTSASESSAFGTVSFERNGEAQQTASQHDINLSGEISIPDDPDTQPSQRVNQSLLEPQVESAAEISVPLSPQPSASTNDLTERFVESESLPREQSLYLQTSEKENPRSVHPHRPPSHPRIKTSRQKRSVEPRANAASPFEVSEDDRSFEINNSEPLDIVEGEQATQLRGNKRHTGRASVARERELRASLPLDQLLERPASANPWPAQEASSSHASEPVINVTIGRIEVKATQSATAEKRTSQRSPVMPLDDYLKLQRRGGTR